MTTCSSCKSTHSYISFNSFWLGHARAEVSNLLSELIVSIHLVCSVLALPSLAYMCLVADKAKKETVLLL